MQLRVRWAVLGAVVVLAGCGGGSDGADRAAPAPEPDFVLTDEQREAQRTVRRYVRAMRAADVAGLCEASSRRERLKPGGVCELRSVAVLGGPRPKVRAPRLAGNVATVRVDRGEEDPFIVTVLRENGRWGVDSMRVGELPSRQEQEAEPAAE